MLKLTLMQWSALAAAAMLVGFSKAGFGSGLGMVATPLMTIALLGKAKVMLPLMLVVLITGDVFSIIHYPKKIAWRNIAILVPGCLLGVGVGWVLLILIGDMSEIKLAGLTGEVILKRMVGGICVFFVGVQILLRWRETKLPQNSLPYRPRAWHGIALGSAAGTTSTLAHAAGPLITLFLLPQKLEKQVFVGTSVAYFFFGNLIKFVPYAAEGMFTPAIVRTSLVMIPAVVLGTLLGVFLNRRMSSRGFVPVIYVLTLAMGVDLLVR